MPSQFRSTLKNEDFDGIVIYPSIVHNCLEGCAFSRIERMSHIIDEFDPLSEERDVFATTIMGASCQLPFDKEGRVILSKHLIKEANLSDTAVFVGKGATFEIWNSSKFEDYSKGLKKIAIEKRSALKFTNNNQNTTN